MIAFVICLALPIVVIECVRHRQKICRALFGWCIGRYYARKNDRLAAVFLAFVMNDIPISDEMWKRKTKLWERCKWWGQVSEEDRPLHIPE